MEFKAIKLECLKTEPVETMDFKKEIDDDDTFDHGPLPGDNLNAPAARTFSHEQNQGEQSSSSTASSTPPTNPEPVPTATEHSFEQPEGKLAPSGDSTGAMRMVKALAKDTTLAYFLRPRCGKERAKLDPTKPKLFKCTTCDKAFSLKGHLTRHVEQVHKKIHKHTCQQCDKVFTGHLDRHFKEVHQQLKPHKCNECGKEFGRAEVLKRHINQVHRGMKPFECNECGKEFGQATNLKGHINQVHRGMKPFECGICGKKFGLKANMKTHVKKVHQAEA